MKKLVLSFAAASMLSGTAMAAGDGAPQICLGCHKATGESVIPEYPKLNGQNAAYLEKALKAYRDGTRKNDHMNTFAKTLTDQDIHHIAEFYSKQD